MREKPLRYSQRIGMVGKAMASLLWGGRKSSQPASEAAEKCPASTSEREPHEDAIVQGAPEGAEPGKYQRPTLRRAVSTPAWAQLISVTA